MQRNESHLPSPFPRPLSPLHPPSLNLRHPRLFHLLNSSSPTRVIRAALAADEGVEGESLLEGDEADGAGEDEVRWEGFCIQISEFEVWSLEFGVWRLKYGGGRWKFGGWSWEGSVGKGLSFWTERNRVSRGFFGFLFRWFLIGKTVS